MNTKYIDEQDRDDDEERELESKRMLAGDIVIGLAGGEFLTKFATSRQTATEMGKTMANIAVAAVNRIWDEIK